MATTLSNKEILELSAEHKTGRYSQRELAKRFNISPAYVNKIVKNIDKIDEEVVNAGIAYKTALASRDEHSVNAIENTVNEATKHLAYINNLTLKNLSVMAKKINEDTTIAEHKMISETVDKSAITLKVAERHAPKVQIDTGDKETNNFLTVEQVSKAVADGLPD